MRTQFDSKIRVVALANLEAMCERVSGVMCHKFSVSRVTKTRAYVEYSNENEYATPQPMTASFSLLPNVWDKSDPYVVLGQIEGVTHNNWHGWHGEGWQAFGPLQDCPTLWRSPVDGSWSTEAEINQKRFMKATMAVPTLAELTDGLGCERWLELRHAKLVASELAIARLASAGLVVRLWMPRPSERASAPDPSSLVAQWARKLAPEDLEAAERLGVERAGVLREELDGLRQDAELSALEVIRIAHERDALECLLTVLWLAGRGQQLGPEVKATDDAAVTSLSDLPASEELEADSLLGAVLVSEPDSWWGQLVSG